MNEKKIRRIIYEKKIWTVKNREIDPELLGFLTSKDCLIVLRHGKPPYRVILGVPHQAAIGDAHICESSNQRDSDENAASYALVPFGVLREHDIPCKLVIMAHSTTTDPNKDPDSPYFREVFQDSAELLIECHGAGSRRRLDLELSAGQNRLADAVEFGQLLASALQHRYTLGVQKKYGDEVALIFERDGTRSGGHLEMAANKTLLLIEANDRAIPALHLEAKPIFRRPPDGSNTVTPDGFILGHALTQVIIKGAGNQVVQYNFGF